VGEKETFLLISRKRPRPARPYYAGIARYDPDTNIATYYPGEQIVRGDWPYGRAVPKLRTSEKGANRLDMQIRYAWDALLTERGLPGCRHPRSDAGEVVTVKDGKLRIRNVRSGEVETLKDPKLGVPTILADDAVWYLVRGRHPGVALDRKTGRLRKLGPQLRKGLGYHNVVRHGEEVWFDWYDPKDVDKHGLRFPIRSAILNLASRTLTVLPHKDLAPFGATLTPIAMDGEWLWGRYYDRDSPPRSYGGKGATFIAAKERSTGQWQRIPYLDERVWFDGDYVFANIAHKLHRAKRSELLQTL